MSDARLLIDIEVLEFLRTLRPKEQAGLPQHFRKIAAFPPRSSDFVEHDSAGRRLDIHIFGKFAVKFWDDFVASPSATSPKAGR